MLPASLWTTIGLGSIIAAILGWLGIKSVMIANHRQAWINALRDDLAEFFTSVDVIHFRMATPAHSGNADDLESQQKARNAVLLAHRKILMRLNMTEALHQDLENKLDRLLLVQGQTPEPRDMTAAVHLARKVLKHEWEVTKYGIFTAPTVCLKTGLKAGWKWLFNRK
jgi:hypothetical protein